jgi:hypothetical protein
VSRTACRDEGSLATQNVMPVSAAIFLLGAHRALLDADGVVVASFSAFEPEAMRVGREWIAQGGHDLWIVGPLEDAPPIAVPLLDQKVPRHSEEDTKVLGFLDDMKRTRGIHSVIFVGYHILQIWPSLLIRL